MKSKASAADVATKAVKKTKPVKEVDVSVTMKTSTVGADGKRIEIIFDNSKKSIVDKLVLHVIVDSVSKLPVRVVYDEVDSFGNKTNRRLSLSKLIFGYKYGKVAVMDSHYSVGHKNGNLLDFRDSNLERRLFGKAV